MACRRMTRFLRWFFDNTSPPPISSGWNLILQNRLYIHVIVATAAFDRAFDQILAGLLRSDQRVALEPNVGIPSIE
jgi:hypothetical protein